jgi:prepilin-type N-terminal cleavage/methylation domain-containing protein
VRVGIPLRRGFTLVEILVVLAILVILFGLLFAPMMTSIEMTTRGRSQVRMQDAARLAIEQIHRELAEAMYIYPTPTIVTPAGTIPDYSQIVFVPPARDDNGLIAQPLRPRMANGQILATRYCVLLRRNNSTSSLGEHDVDNPFILWRQEGTYVHDAATNTWDFAPTAGTSGNALTPKDRCDLVPRATISVTPAPGSAVTVYPGYYYPTDPASTEELHYLFDCVQFMPERIAGEVLAPNTDGFLYTATHGGWLGTVGNGNAALATSALVEAALDPRFVVYRANAPVFDSNTAVRPLNLSYDSNAGTVRVGSDWNGTVSFNSLDTDPQSMATPQAWWGTTTAVPAPASGTLTAVAPTGIIWRQGDARAPSAYYVQAQGSSQTSMIVPSSVRVWVTATWASGGYTQTIEYTPTADTNQSELGPTQFAFVPDDHNLGGEIRFSKYYPPSPDQYGPANTLSALTIYIYAFTRENYDPTTFVTDSIRADYWTRDIINVTLQISQYVDLEPDEQQPAALVLPQRGRPATILMRDQVTVRNPGR